MAQPRPVLQRTASALFQILLFSYGLFWQAQAFKKTVCRHVAAESDTTAHDAEVLELYTDTCPLSASPFSVYGLAGEQGDRRSNPALLVCWTPAVRRFAMKFASSVLLADATPLPGKVIHTCALPNDTVYVGHRRMEKRGISRLLLKLPSQEQATTFRVYQNIRGRKKAHLHKMVDYTFNPDGAQATLRRKRDVSDGNVRTQPSECGKTRGCYRMGSEGCGHFECDYYVSYKVQGNNIDIEMSAKAPGWVAIGFSSDERMGGDEVIVCHRARAMAETILVNTYKNPYRNEAPIKLDVTDSLRLEQSELRDGYIYCWVTRLTSVDDHQDLTNDWFQFYAFGDMAQSGALEKHQRTPTVSSSKITALKIQSVYSSGCVGLEVTATSYILAIVLALVVDT